MCRRKCRLTAPYVATKAAWIADRREYASRTAGDENASMESNFPARLASDVATVTSRSDAPDRRRSRRDIVAGDPELGWSVGDCGRLDVRQHDFLPTRAYRLLRRSHLDGGWGSSAGCVGGEPNLLQPLDGNNRRVDHRIGQGLQNVTRNTIASFHWSGSRRSFFRPADNRLAMSKGAAAGSVDTNLSQSRSSFEFHRAETADRGALRFI